MYSTVETVTTYFLKALINGSKRRILGHEVRHISIPQYEGLNVLDMAGFVKKHNAVNGYLPDGKEVLKMPKGWIANVINTVKGKEFTAWVKERIEERNAKLLVEKGLAIEMDAEVAEAFNASTKTSSKCLLCLATDPFFIFQHYMGPACICLSRMRSGGAPRSRSPSRRPPSWRSRT